METVLRAALIFCLFSPVLSDMCGICYCGINSHFISCNSRNLTAIPLLRHKFTALFVLDVSDNMLTSLDAVVIRSYNSSYNNTEVLHGVDELCTYSDHREMLRRLIASHNVIEGLPSLRHMTSLVYLDLSWNRIVTSVNADHFRDATNLDYLSLGHNEITCLAKNSFKKLHLLTELDISYNRLTSRANDVTHSSCFPADVICDLRNLIVLRISSNYLPELFQIDGYFACLPNLTLLEASNCGVTTLSRDVFRGLDHLISLDLSDNFIATWTSGTLRHMGSLVYVDLAQNFIANFPADFLQGTPKLTHLQIQNNQLHHLDYKWLEYIGNKQLTNLSQSQGVARVELYISEEIQFLDFSVEKHNNRLFVDWSENPWLCDCNLVRFVGWLVAEGKWLSQVKGHHDVICFEPSVGRFTSRAVYVNGQINRSVMRILLRNCTTSVDLHVTSSINDVTNEDVTTQSVTGVSDYSGSYEVTSSNNTAFERSQRLAPLLPTIITASLVLDLLIYLLIFTLFKRKLCCRSITSKIHPMTSSSTSV